MKNKNKNKNNRARKNRNPQVGRTVQGLGRGETKRIITKDYSISSNGTETIPFHSFLTESTEFLQTAVLYRFMKVEKIQVTVFPGTTGSSSALVKPYRLLLVWTDDSSASTNVAEDDSVVLVPNFGFKPITRTFLPINCNMLTGANLSGIPCLNPREWVVIDDICLRTSEALHYYYPGSLIVSHPSAGNYRLSIYIKFKNSKIMNSNLLKELLKIESRKEEASKQQNDQKEVQLPNDQLTGTNKGLEMELGPKVDFRGRIVIKQDAQTQTELKMDPKVQYSYRRI